MPKMRVAIRPPAREYTVDGGRPGNVTICGFLLGAAPLRRLGIAGGEWEDRAGIAAAISAYDHEHPDGMPPDMLDYLRPVRR
jgi:hypothetical protein